MTRKALAALDLPTLHRLADAALARSSAARTLPLVRAAGLPRWLLVELCLIGAMRR